MNIEDIQVGATYSIRYGNKDSTEFNYAQTVEEIYHATDGALMVRWAVVGRRYKGCKARGQRQLRHFTKSAARRLTESEVAELKGAQ